MYFLWKSEKVIENLKKFQESTNQIFFGVDFESANVLNLKSAVEAYNSNKGRVIFAYLDQNSQSNNPGWPLRNFLALLSLKWWIKFIKNIILQDLVRYWTIFELLSQLLFGKYIDLVL